METRKATLHTARRDIIYCYFSNYLKYKKYSRKSEVFSQQDGINKGGTLSASRLFYKISM